MSLQTCTTLVLSTPTRRYTPHVAPVSFPPLHSLSFFPIHLSFTARVIAPSPRTLMGVVCCASGSGCRWPLRQAIIRRSHRQC